MFQWQGAAYTVYYGAFLHNMLPGYASALIGPLVVNWMLPQTQVQRIHRWAQGWAWIFSLTSLLGRWEVFLKVPLSLSDISIKKQCPCDTFLWLRQTAY